MNPQALAAEMNSKELFIWYALERSLGGDGWVCALDGSVGVCWQTPDGCRSCGIWEADMTVDEVVVEAIHKLSRVEMVW